MNTSVEVTLSEGPLPPPSPWRPRVAGAVVQFEGVVRPTEEQRPLAALSYEAYEPMTSRELRRLAQRALADHGLVAVRVEHSVGRVGVGEVSFRLSTAAAHRAEAIAAADEFIREMKRGVPLWKTPVWREADRPHDKP